MEATNVYYHSGGSEQIEAILHTGFTDTDYCLSEEEDPQRGVNVTGYPRRTGRDYPDIQILEIILPAGVDIIPWARVMPGRQPNPFGEWIVPSDIMNAFAKSRLLTKEEWDEACKRWDQDNQTELYEDIKITIADWWKYPDSFLKVIVNTGETKLVTREKINTEILESLIPGWERQRKCPEDPLCMLVEVPRFAGYVIHTAWSDAPGFGIDDHCYGYFASKYDDADAIWEVVEHDYLQLTEKSDLQWDMPPKPESAPFLAVIRLTNNQLTAPHAAQPGPDWLAEVESAIGFLFMKTLSEWGSKL